MTSWEKQLIQRVEELSRILCVQYKSKFPSLFNGGYCKVCHRQSRLHEIIPNLHSETMEDALRSLEQLELMLRDNLQIYFRGRYCSMCGRGGHNFFRVNPVQPPVYSVHDVRYRASSHVASSNSSSHRKQHVSPKRSPRRSFERGLSRSRSRSIGCSSCSRSRSRS